MCNIRTSGKSFDVSGYTSTHKKIEDTEIRLHCIVWLTISRHILHIKWILYKQIYSKCCISWPCYSTLSHDDRQKEFVNEFKLNSEVSDTHSLTGSISPNWILSVYEWATTGKENIDLGNSGNVQFCVDCVAGRNNAQLHCFFFDVRLSENEK